ncbi:MAG TPA: SET domain-containing protein-lysine N-methyltransferase [Burkholderiales bacterium]|nr:SET domain-containing protein-lysine N-methyltransferase [Burkholderiales bacterium]
MPQDSKRPQRPKKTRKLPGKRRIVVRNSGIHGKGVFAIARISKGTRVIEYKGRRMSGEAADRKYGNDEGPHTFLFLLDDGTVIDANREGNSARWINHSCDPNCEPEEENGRMFIDARRDIRPGEELTYDYQLFVEERYTPALKRLYACSCGSRKCRGNFLAEKD